MTEELKKPSTPEPKLELKEKKLEEKPKTPEELEREKELKNLDLKLREASDSLAQIELLKIDLITPLFSKEKEMQDAELLNRRTGINHQIEEKNQLLEEIKDISKRCGLKEVPKLPEFDKIVQGRIKECFSPEGLKSLFRTASEGDKKAKEKIFRIKEEFYLREEAGILNKKAEELFKELLAGYERKNQEVSQEFEIEKIRSFLEKMGFKEWPEQNWRENWNFRFGQGVPDYGRALREFFEKIPPGVYQEKTKAAEAIDYLKNQIEWLEKWQDIYNKYQTKYQTLAEGLDKKGKFSKFFSGIEKEGRDLGDFFNEVYQETKAVVNGNLRMKKIKLEQLKEEEILQARKEFEQKTQEILNYLQTTIKECSQIQRNIKELQPFQDKKQELDIQIRQLDELEKQIGRLTDIDKGKEPRV